MSEKTEPLLSDAEDIHQDSSLLLHDERETSDTENAENFGFFQEEPKPTLLELAQKIPDQTKNLTMHDIVMRHLEEERQQSGFNWIVAKMRKQAAERYGEERSEREECDR